MGLPRTVSERNGENCKLWPVYYLTLPLRRLSMGFCNGGYGAPQKTRMMSLLDDKTFDDMSIRLDTIPALDGRTDERNC